MDIISYMNGYDAVFLPNKIHGCADQAYIVYFNECGGDKNRGCFEIEIVDKPRILKLYEEVGDNAKAFFEKLPDLFCGEWRYCDRAHADFESLAENYASTDFICHRDGDETAEMLFLVNWAKKA